MFSIRVAAVAALAAFMAISADAQQTVCINGKCYQLAPARPVVAVQRVVTRPVLSPVVALPAFSTSLESRAILSDSEIVSAVAAAVAEANAKHATAMNSIGDGDREVGRRLVFKLHVRRLQREGQEVDRIRVALADDDKFELLYQAAREGYSAPVVGGPFLDAMQAWLKYLIENPDKVIALIQKLIVLFGSPDVPAAFPAFAAVPAPVAFPSATGAFYTFGGGCGCDCPNCNCGPPANGAVYGRRFGWRWR